MNVYEGGNIFYKFAGKKRYFKNHRLATTGLLNAYKKCIFFLEVRKKKKKRMEIRPTNDKKEKENNENDDKRKPLSSHLQPPSRRPLDSSHSSLPWGRWGSGRCECWRCRVGVGGVGVGGVSVGGVAV